MKLSNIQSMFLYKVVHYKTLNISLVYAILYKFMIIDAYKNVILPQSYIAK